MPETISQWVSLILSVITLAGIVYGWFTWGQKTSAADLTAFKDKQSEALGEIEDKLDAHDRRIQNVETELKHLPDKDSVVELKLAMADLKGTVGRLDESLNSVQRTVLRIDDWLRTDRAK